MRSSSRRSVTQLVSLLAVSSLAVAGCSADASDARDDVAIDQAEVTSAFVCDGKESNFGFHDFESFGHADFAAVRAAGRPEAGFDRFVVEFKPGANIKRWMVVPQNDSSFFLGMSDETIKLEGNAGIALIVGDTSLPQDDMPDHIKVPNGSNMTEAMLTDTHAADMQWSIGLNKRNSCYRAFELSNPPRIVLDVKR
jgi:hypothetical protein